MLSAASCRRSALACCFFGLGTTACQGEAPAPSWTFLAEGRFDTTLERTQPALARLADGSEVRLVYAGDDAWIETELTRADWRYRPGLKLWRAELALQGRGYPPAGTPAQRLLADGRSFEFRSAKVRYGDELPANSFKLAAGRLVLRLEEGEEPPEKARLQLFALRHRETGTNGSRGMNRFRGRRYGADAIALWPGESATLVTDLPPGAALRFATGIELATERDPIDGRAVTFRVTLDDTTVFEEELKGFTGPDARWHTVQLPAEGRAGARLGFQVEGSLAHTAFLAPSLGPARIGTLDARPFESAGRPLALLVADTFRADLMQTYGGELELTPFLDRLAQESLVFTHAWSSGTYTLPSHVSMFTGLWPRQAGISGIAVRLPAEITTIAERLRDAGYRTLAVTDAGIVSQHYGLDQGFELFDQDHGTLESTLERVQAALAGDDGRPPFLFVQSYRTHLPYEVTEETRGRFGTRLDLGPGAHDRDDALRAALAAEAHAAAGAERPLERLRHIHDVYRGTAVDLDRGFERLYGMLDARGFFARGRLIFTSDHGEAFGEHDVLYHTGKVWEELARVPLFFHGAGIAPGRDAHPASLVDVAPTLADWAGLPHDDTLVPGRVLPGADPERTVLVFECAAEGPSTVAVIRGEKKAIALEEGGAALAEMFGAYALDRDPAEREDLRSAADWPRRLLEEQAAELARALAPLGASQQAELDDEKLEELRALGYVED